MNLKRFCRLSISAALLAGSPITATACGPYISIIPSPEFFGLSRPQKTMADYDREENLRLWQSMTSTRIPLQDIEEVVYNAPLRQYYDNTIYYSPTKSNNLFYAYLNNLADFEITDFIFRAKEIEAEREQLLSPWYYPCSNNSIEARPDLSVLINSCKEYAGTRLKDRYALQTTRALFASGRYAECIEYADTAFATFPDSNLMKRMARRYAAGCWSRLGDRERADTIFASVGDVWSVSDNRRISIMAEVNPGAPQLIEYLRSNANDSVFMRGIEPIAHRLLRDRRVSNKGDWNFLLAYVDNRYNRNPHKARIEIYEAMRQSFSSEELRDNARAYKMKLDGQTNNRASLIVDLKWMEEKFDFLNPNASDWQRKLENIIFVDWIPQLWRRKDYATAILLSSYTDNFAPFIWMNAQKEGYNLDSLTGSLRWDILRKMRKSQAHMDDSDYGGLAFQLMGSLTSRQLASTYDNILKPTPLFTFLRQRARTDKDYFNELIGTLAIREENYARAVSYLSKVNTAYLETMDINCYLGRDPFIPYPSRWDDDDEWSLEHSSFTPYDDKSNPSGKIDFARQMLAYQRQMRYGHTDDERGMARLMYAIGRRNSFEECWALTQYWRGENRVFEPRLDDWACVFERNNYSFLYDYITTVGHKAAEELYRREVAAALAMLTSDEAKARAQYILGNVKTVIKLYGNTSTAQLVRNSCDRWRQWL